MVPNVEKRFDGRTVVVTGAARGMGAVLAGSYAAEGADVALFDRSADGLAETAAAVERHGRRALPVTVDIADCGAAEAAMRTATDRLGPVHILANCAGISAAGRLVDMEENDWDRVMNVNLKSAWNLSKFAARSMIDGGVRNGKIISISSQASKIGEEGNGLYSISKAGINMLTQVLALELAEYGIAVTAVAPGYVRTDMVVQVFQERGPLLGMTPEAYEKTLTDSVPMKRMATPEEIVRLMLFLTSDEAGYITGVTITSAGGKTLI